MTHEGSHNKCDRGPNPFRLIRDPGTLATFRLNLNLNPSVFLTRIRSDIMDQDPG
mgnify:CR=1 FL=1